MPNILDYYEQKQMGSESFTASKTRDLLTTTDSLKAHRDTPLPTSTTHPSEPIPCPAARVSSLPICPGM